MKLRNKILMYFIFLLCFSSGYCLTSCVDVFASEVNNGVVSNFRSNYDMVMKWINFLILLIIFFKYGYKPIKNFIGVNKGVIEKQIKSLEKKKQLKMDELDKVVEIAHNNELRLIELKKRIVREGEVKCNDIINSARKQSELMLEKAYQQAEYRFLRARDLIKNEVIDSVISLVKTKLPEFVDEEFNDSLLNDYIESISDSENKKML